MRRFDHGPSSICISVARKAVALDVDLKLLNRSDEHVFAVVFAAQDG